MIPRFTTEDVFTKIKIACNYKSLENKSLQNTKSGSESFWSRKQWFLNLKLTLYNLDIDSSHIWQRDLDSKPKISGHTLILNLKVVLLYSANLYLRKIYGNGELETTYVGQCINLWLSLTRYSRLSSWGRSSRYYPNLTSQLPPDRAVSLKFQTS